jgi:NADH:ubiquinone oxidoreductase subunit C
VQELAEHIAEQLGDVIQAQNIRLGELILTVRSDDIVKVLTFLRDDAHVTSRSCWMSAALISQTVRSGLRSFIIY